MKLKTIALSGAISVPLLWGLAVARGSRLDGSKSSLDQTIKALFAVRTFRDCAVSPDGSKVAWAEWIYENGTPTSNSAIYVTDVQSASIPSRITAGSGSAGEHDLAWSPDGKRLAFLSDAAKPGQLDLYVTDLDGGAARRLTHLLGFVAKPSWSPNGKTIALLFIENARRAAGPLEPMTKDAGVVEEHIYEQRVATVDLESGQARQISPANLYVYEYDWSPDGRSLVASAAHGNGDNNWWVAQLYTISLATGDAKSIFKPPLQIAVPRWSPDGKNITFISGLMSDEGSTGGDIFVVPANGGAARNLTPGMKASAAWLSWKSPNEVLFVESVDGASGVATANLDEHKIRTLWRGSESISTGHGLGLSFARDGKTSVVIRHSFSDPPEVWAGTLGEWKQITHINREARPAWGKAENLHWTSDGRQIQGWLVYPTDYDPARHYPLVVSVHGGPGAAALPAWPARVRYAAALPAQGYWLLYPNPRGSFGEGESFTQGNVKDFGYGDLRDILGGIDHVIGHHHVDRNKMGITGWSYGGFMTMWAVTQTHRFRAAVAGAGISNWQSYYGENDIDQWMTPFFGASVYDDPSVYAKSSPINYIKNAKTPTLILVGDSDGECPTPQSYEFWHALKTFGVETEFVVYPNEGHAINQPAHQRDIIERAVEWFNRYLQ